MAYSDTLTAHNNRLEALIDSADDLPAGFKCVTGVFTPAKTSASTTINVAGELIAATLTGTYNGATLCLGVTPDLRGKTIYGQINGTSAFSLTYSAEGDLIIVAGIMIPLTYNAWYK